MIVIGDVSFNAGSLYAPGKVSLGPTSVNSTLYVDRISQYTTGGCVAIGEAADSSLTLCSNDGPITGGAELSTASLPVLLSNLGSSSPDGSIRCSANLSFAVDAGIDVIGIGTSMSDSVVFLSPVRLDGGPLDANGYDIAGVASLYGNGGDPITFASAVSFPNNIDATTVSVSTLNVTAFVRSELVYSESLFIDSVHPYHGENVSLYASIDMRSQNIVNAGWIVGDQANFSTNVYVAGMLYARMDHAYMNALSPNGIVPVAVSVGLDGGGTASLTNFTSMSLRDTQTSTLVFDTPTTGPTANASAGRIGYIDDGSSTLMRYQPVTGGWSFAARTTLRCSVLGTLVTLSWNGFSAVPGPDCVVNHTITLDAASIPPLCRLDPSFTHSIPTVVIDNGLALSGLVLVSYMGLEWTPSGYPDSGGFSCLPNAEGYASASITYDMAPDLSPGSNFTAWVVYGNTTLWNYASDEDVAPAMVFVGVPACTFTFEDSNVPSVVPRSNTGAGCTIALASPAAFASIPNGFYVYTLTVTDARGSIGVFPVHIQISSS